MSSPSNHTPPESQEPSKQPVLGDNGNITPPPSYSQTATQSRWIWLIPLMLVILGIGVWAGRMWGEKKAQEQLAATPTSSSVTPQMATATGVTQVPVTQKPVLSVDIITPKQSVFEDSLSADGTIVPKTVATVNGKVSGVTIEQVLAEEGSWVKKGQVLAVFDTQAMQQQQVQAQADLAEAQTKLQLAESDANRVLPLLEINAVSEQEADRYVATARQAAAAVAAAEARLNNQNLNLNNAKVTAPVSGIISEKTANVGSVAGQAPLFTIIENGTLEWQAQVDPNKLGEINVGTPVQVSLPNKRSVMGKVTRIAPTAEQGSRQVSIYATLANSKFARAGMYQRGTFMLGKQGGQTLPVSAIISNDGYDYVMLVELDKGEDGEDVYRVRRKKVEIAERLGDEVLLAKPLPESVAIVRQGGGFLNDGDVVRLASEQANSSAAKDAG